MLLLGFAFFVVDTSVASTDKKVKRRTVKPTIKGPPEIIPHVYCK